MNLTLEPRRRGLFSWLGAWPKFFTTFTQSPQTKTMFRTLDELITALETVLEAADPTEKITHLQPLVGQYNGVDWRRFANPATEFSRTMVYRSKMFEVLLISWKKDYTTPFHSHPANGCILRVLEGGLIENRKSPDGTHTEMYVHGPNSISFMHDDEGTHQIIANTRTFSLHIYAPPGFFSLGHHREKMNASLPAGL